MFCFDHFPNFFGTGVMVRSGNDIPGTFPFPATSLTERTQSLNDRRFTPGYP
jgi:hypothetical protein